MANDAMKLLDGLSPGAKARARAKAEIMILINKLTRLREEGGLTQSELAERLQVKQAAVSRMEGRSDLKVSSLLRYLEALGAHNIRILADIGGKRRRMDLTP